MKKNDKTNNISVMQEIIDSLNDRNKTLTNRLECLEDQLDAAYCENAELQQELEKEDDFKNLVNLNTMLLIFMGLTQNYCNGSDLGECIQTSIENFYCDTAKSILKQTQFWANRKELLDNNDDEEIGGDDGSEN